MEMGKLAVPPLESTVADRLLDLLSTDDAFRALFVADTYAALLQAGHVPHADADESTVHPGLCLFTPNLASKEKIAAHRERLAKSLSALPFTYQSPAELQAD